MPFNAEQTVNILERDRAAGAMFLVNGMYGIAAGTWALIISTHRCRWSTTLWCCGRLPVLPFIACAVSVVFGSADDHHQATHVGADQGDDLQR